MISHAVNTGGADGYQNFTNAFDPPLPAPPMAITLVEFRAKRAPAQPAGLPAGFILSGLGGLLGSAGIGLYICRRN